MVVDVVKVVLETAHARWAVVVAMPQRQLWRRHGLAADAPSAVDLVERWQNSDFLIACSKAESNMGLKSSNQSAALV